MTRQFDMEAALRDVARSRQRDSLTRQTAEHGDALATQLQQRFGPGEAETAGLALVNASALLGAFAKELTAGQDVVTANIARTLLNLLAFAGQRMVTDARAAERPGDAS